MASVREIREQKVNEAKERWYNMETSELVAELKTLNEQEECHSENLLLIKALKKALKEVLSNRNEDELFDPDCSADDNLRSVETNLY